MAADSRASFRLPILLVFVFPWATDQIVLHQMKVGAMYLIVILHKYKILLLTGEIAGWAVVSEIRKKMGI
ncbi:hypothetical protein BC940DRAFT_133875 [Gongronella butleri]|nr:hypothetical protein BC940DRAFT_133875 [Gongronella butleri]